MIPNMLRVNWWEYHFQAQWDSSWWNSFMEFYYDSLMRWDSHDKVIFKVQWSTYKEAENKMIAVLQNAWILPKPKKKRTLAQNSLYRKWLDIIWKDTGNDPEVLHVKMKKLYLSKRKRVVINKKITYENIMGSTTTLNVEEFTDFLNKVYTFFSDMWYVLPTMEQSDIDSLINTYWKY
jgi:hypothetical protein